MFDPLKDSPPNLHVIFLISSSIRGEFYEDDFNMISIISTSSSWNIYCELIKNKNYKNFKKVLGDGFKHLNGSQTKIRTLTIYNNLRTIK